VSDGEVERRKSLVSKHSKALSLQVGRVEDVEKQIQQQDQLLQKKYQELLAAAKEIGELKSAAEAADKELEESQIAAGDALRSKAQVEIEMEEMQNTLRRVEQEAEDARNAAKTKSQTLQDQLDEAQAKLETAIDGQAAAAESKSQLEIEVENLKMAVQSRRGSKQKSRSSTTVLGVWNRNWNT